MDEMRVILSEKQQRETAHANHLKLGDLLLGEMALADTGKRVLGFIPQRIFTHDALL